MELSNEDSLRLNVLLNQDLQALRIDESKMIVYGLSEKGEAKVPLKANCKDEVYIKRVKELISTHVLGSPGGYPIFLRRWTRMGQSRTHESLERLLQLGEPEAVVAVVNADEVSNEIARRAWWAMPCSDNARCLLRQQDVVKGDMGKVLADFLVEFLPFEEEPRAMIESARLVLQQDLVSEAVKKDLWKKGQRKNALHVGFLRTLPDKLPLEKKPHALFDKHQSALEAIKDENVYASLIYQLLTEEGQAYIATVESVIKKPSNQDVVVALCETVKDYFSPVRPTQAEYQDIDDIMMDIDKYIEVSHLQNEQLSVFLDKLPDLKDMLKASLVLSCVGEPLVRPVFSRTDAIGSLMRKKLEPVFKPLFEHIALLKG